MRSACSTKRYTPPREPSCASAKHNPRHPIVGFLSLLDLESGTYDDGTGLISQAFVDITWGPREHTEKFPSFSQPLPSDLTFGRPEVQPTLGVVLLQTTTRPSRPPGGKRAMALSNGSFLRPEDVTALSPIHSGTRRLSLASCGLAVWQSQVFGISCSCEARSNLCQRFSFFFFSPSIHLSPTQCSRILGPAVS